MHAVTKSPYVSESGDYYKAVGYYTTLDTINTEEYENVDKSNLEYLYISDNCSKIEGESFKNCSNLVLVYAAGVKSISTESFLISFLPIAKAGSTLCPPAVFDTGCVVLISEDEQIILS